MKLFFSMILSIFITVLSVVQTKGIDSINLAEKVDAKQQSVFDDAEKGREPAFWNNQVALEVVKGSEIIEDYKQYIREDTDESKEEMIDDI